MAQPRGATKTKEKPRIEFDLAAMQPWREYAVILHNDEEHTVMEVILQLVRALDCSFHRAQELTMTVHHNGRARIAIAGREKAMQIAGVLRQINLRVTLRQLN